MSSASRLFTTSNNEPKANAAASSVATASPRSNGGNNNGHWKNGSTAILPTKTNFYDLTSTNLLRSKGGTSRSISSTPRTARNCSVMDDGGDFHAKSQTRASSLDHEKYGTSSRSMRPLKNSAMKTNVSVIDLVDDDSDNSCDNEDIRHKKNFSLEKGIISSRVAVPNGIGHNNYNNSNSNRYSNNIYTNNDDIERKDAAIMASLQKQKRKRPPEELRRLGMMQVDQQRNGDCIENIQLTSDSVHNNGSSKVVSSPKSFSATINNNNVTMSHPSHNDARASCLKPHNPYKKSTNISSGTVQGRVLKNNNVSNYPRLGRTNAMPHRPSQKTKDGAMITYGLVNLIGQLQNKDVVTCAGNSHCAANNPSSQQLVFDHQPFHYSQSDNWSCGFRNLQMMISSMLPTLMQMFPNGVPPINEMQSSLELLWSEGFDLDGAKHHNYKMIGKKSWIGTVEVWSYLAFRGIDATIVQFVKTQESRAALGKFVWAYFSKMIGADGCACCSSGRDNDSDNSLASPSMKSIQYVSQLLQIIRTDGGSGRDGECVCQCCKCSRPPLYLQWSGHSVSIVGIRRVKCVNDAEAFNERFHLIIFDPMKNGPLIKSKLSAQLNRKTSDTGHSHDCTSVVELATHTLRNKDCQILLSTARLIDDVERDRCKTKISCITAMR